MITITKLEIENVKRVKAVSVAPSETGLTVIGGKNGQGKTSVLDAIAWALGGEKFRPSEPTREGSVIPPRISVTLSNGIRVERSGKNSSLKVTDPSGKNSGQALLNAFISQFALNLPAFMNMSGRDKAQTLLHICGIGELVAELDAAERRAYNERLALGRIADQKTKAAAEMPRYENVPADFISASELIRQQQTILLQNAENARLRARADELGKLLDQREAQAKELRERLDALRQEILRLQEEYGRARNVAENLTDESAEALENNLYAIEDTNRKIRANLDKEKASDEAKALTEQYNDISANIEQIRRQKMLLLDGATLPLPELSVENGELTYKGHQWDCMSGSEQLQVATAIVRKLNPNCGFVLVDKLEQMDTDTLAAFGEWLRAQGLQAIATRVGTGSECSIIIEDGVNVTEPRPLEPVRKWTAGKF